ncbi:hypothetical protein [Treponema sp.]|uniref:hypothetical protein n=1 Tax=Treponema sp. TaxID=166 RepID=UPI00298EADDA|nr:hypothetical protein [Treponema sp.]
MKKLLLPNLNTNTGKIPDITFSTNQHILNPDTKPAQNFKIYRNTIFVMPDILRENVIKLT